MSLLTANDLSLAYGPLDVFEGLSCAVAEGDRIGLVGPNGEGKTTLLRILADEIKPDRGHVHRRRGLRWGYLPQIPPPAAAKTLWEDMLEVFADLRAEEAALADLENRLAEPDAGVALLDTYAARQHAFEVNGGYEYPLRIQQTLTGLGFKPEQFHLPLAQLSGGQRTRALLARLLLQKPDMLLLDEPTNHLDLQAVEWLEHILLGWQGGMIIVAHDRYFLDRVVMKTWELVWGEMHIYRGNYSAYVQQRQERLRQMRKSYEAQQAFIAREEDYIRRNIAGQNTRQAQGRRTRLRRLLAQQQIVAPHKRRRMTLEMRARLRSGSLVLATNDLAIGYYDRPSATMIQERSGGHVYKAPRPPTSADTLLFRADDVRLERQERVGLIGPNGSGKTTFVKTLLGQIPPLGGELRVGASVRIGYLAQVQDAFDPQHTLLNVLLEADPNLTVGEARHWLARFLFVGDDVDKTVSTLSGGQRSRLALAVLARQESNFLVMDEPTNHLDIESQEVLQAMLEAFNGTVLLVSHDRYLINALATQVWAIADDRLQTYEGNYSDYLVARQEAVPQGDARPTPLTASQQQRKLSQEQRRQRREQEKRQAEADALEARIHALEAELGQVGVDLAVASQAMQLDEVQRLSEVYARAEEQLHQLIEKWANLV
ncbi:MAG: ABC-F family ATP-binding cassette domain-containing protein [Chloroflexi bacterium]|nr:ABC-F family ATP-binding cassette domain-containing protein [Chloroflexota bacterium]